MVYNITRTNGLNLVDLDEQIVDTTTISGIGLIGKLTQNYGETQSNNFVHIIENFSNDEFPLNPLTGQLCYRFDLQTLYLCVDENAENMWQPISLTFIQSNEPAPMAGILWFNPETNILSLYNTIENRWVNINSIQTDNSNIIEKNMLSDKFSNGEYKFSYDFSLFDSFFDCGYIINVSLLIRELIDETNTDYLSIFPDIYSEDIKILINSKKTYINTTPIKEITIVGYPVRNITSYKLDSTTIDISFTTQGSVLNIIVGGNVERNASKLLCNVNSRIQTVCDKSIIV